MGNGVIAAKLMNSRPNRVNGADNVKEKPARNTFVNMSAPFSEGTPVWSHLRDTKRRTALKKATPKYTLLLT